MSNSIVIPLLLSMAAFVCCQLNPERLQLVDQNQKLNNYLIRGNLPIGKDQKFQMKGLRKHLQSITGLDKYDLIVISFLNFLTAKQTKNRYIEEKFFDENPSEGQYQTKLILGSLINPLQLPESIIKSLQLLKYVVDIDGIDELLSDLYQLIHKKGRNKIVFIHCSAGMDRTGYVAGSYKLKYLNSTLKEVLKENERFGGSRKYMHFNALNGLRWFCYSQKGKQQCTQK